MTLRFLPLVFGAVALFGMVTAWQLLDDSSPARAEIPENRAEPVVGEITIEPVALDEPEESEARGDLLIEIPPLPELENDAGKGAVWVQLIDDETGRPMPGTDCRVLGFDYGTNDYDYRSWGVIDDLTRFENLRSDEHGLVRLSSAVTDGGEARPGIHVAFDEYDGMLRYALPVPQGWYPSRSLEAIAGEFRELFFTPRSTPINVPVRRTAQLTIDVVDERGNPVKEASLHPLAPSGATSPSRVWVDRFGLVADCCDEEDFAWAMSMFRDEFRGSQVRGAINDVALEGAEMWRATRDEIFHTDQRGRHVQPCLPRTRFAVFAWHREFGMGQCDVEIDGEDLQVTITLTMPESASLNLRVEWRDEPLDDRDTLTVYLTPSGPFGEHPTIEDHLSYDFKWEIPGSKTHLWVGRIDGIPPGYWQLGAVVWGADGENSRHIQLHAGQCEDVTLYTGYESECYWRPNIFADGRRVPELNLKILGGEWREPWDFDVDYDDEAERTEELKLLAGTYKVWAPTLPMREITLAPGQTREDDFHLKVQRIKFSVDAELAALLEDEEQPLVLGLSPVDPLACNYDDVFPLFSESGSKREIEYLAQGEVRTWCVPHGRYEWELFGDEEGILGELRVDENTPPAIHFEIGALPGLAALKINLEGFDEDDMPSIDAALFADLAPNLNGAPGYRSGPCIIFPDDVDTIERVDELTHYLFVRPGRVRLYVECDAGEIDFVTDAPGEITVTRDQCAAHGKVKVELLAQAGSAYEYEVLAIDAQGGIDESWASGDSAEGSVRVRAGLVTLQCRRSLEVEGGRQIWEYAKLDTPVGINGARVELWRLNFQQPASLTLRLRGPAQGWWCMDSSWDEFEEPELYALDWNVSGAPRRVVLEEFDSALDDTRPELTYRDRPLPPGRYRLIPWPGAPKEDWKTFTLKPGKQHTVLVDTAG